MKYLKYSFLVAFLLALNVNLFGQEPCTELKVKIDKPTTTILTTEVGTVVLEPSSPLNGLTLKCPDDISVIIDSPSDAATINWTEPEAETDCLSMDIVISQITNYTNAGDFNEGTWVVEYLAQDECNNATYCQFSITVSTYTPKVIFVHGFGGDFTSWGQAATWTTNNYVNSTGLTLEYNQGSGLEVAAGDLNTKIEGTVSDLMGTANTKANRKSNFIIAHSQGGVVSQYAELTTRKNNLPLAQNANNNWDEEIYYGGLVTFGSPHQGAYILNSLVEDDDGNWVYNDGDDNTKTRFEEFSEYTTKVLAATQIEAIKAPWLLGGQNLAKKLKTIAYEIVDAAQAQATSYIVDAILNPTNLGL